MAGSGFHATACAVDPGTQMKTIGFALVLTIVACGTGNPSPPPGAGNAAQTVAVQTAAVRLQGVGASGPVRVRVASLALTADGHALAGQLTGSEIDIGNAQNSLQVMTFGLPADAHSVAIKLQFQPEGTVERNGKTQALDLRGPPVSLVADAAQIRTSSKVVLEVDLARSLVDQSGNVLLMPNFTIRY